LCVAGLERLRQRSGELVDLDFVGVKLCGVDPRMTEKRPKRDITANLTQEAVSEP
jgi:hypothetical protein